MAVRSLHQPPKSVHSAAPLVHVESLLGLKQLRYGSPTATIILEVDITHQIMRVEIELFETEGRRHFPFFVYVGGIEELLLGVVLEHVPCLRVGQVASNVGRLAQFIDVIALIVLEDDDVSSIVPIELSQDVMHVERPIVSVRGHVNWMLLLFKVLNRVIIDFNSLQDPFSFL